MWFETNDPHHGAAGVDFDFKTRSPPPRLCMRWFVVYFANNATISKGTFPASTLKSSGIL
jgi:hypothetical protein